MGTVDTDKTSRKHHRGRAILVTVVVAGVATASWADPRLGAAIATAASVLGALAAYVYRD